MNDIQCHFRTLLNIIANRLSNKGCDRGNAGSVHCLWCFTWIPAGTEVLVESIQTLHILLGD